MVSDLNKLGIALKSLDAMNLGTVGINLGNVEAYRAVLKGLSVEQSVFALASKGATEEQIRQILVTDQSISKDVEAAMAKAGLTTATKALNAEELIELATKKGISTERAKEIASALGLIATEEGQVVSKKQLTVAILKQVGATDAEITAILGLNAAETTNIGITNVLTALFTKLWAVITAHPIGAILTAIGAVAVGAIAYINKTNKEAEEALVEAHENAKQALEDTKNSLSEDKSELQSVNSELETTKDKLREISSIGAPTLTEQNELTKLSTANAQLEAQKTLLENNIKLKQKSAALDAKELLGTQVEMEYSNILDGTSIESHNESYTYEEHAKYQASNLKNAYNIYMKALREGNVTKQQLAQELIDASAGDTATLTTELLGIVESFKYDDGTIIEGYEELYNEYMGMIYNLQSLTNPDTFLEVAKSITVGTGIDYEKAILEAYQLAYDGNFDIDSLNQDFVKALSEAGIDESTIDYIFSLKQQEYQLLVDKINAKYQTSEVPDTVTVRKDYWNADGTMSHEYVEIDADKETKKHLEEVNSINESLNDYARENPIEFQLVSSYDNDFALLDKYIEEERVKAEKNADYVGDYISNAIQRVYDEAKVQGSTQNPKSTLFSGFSEEDTKLIDAFQSEVKTLGDTLSSLQSGEDVDFTDLVQEFPELQGESENLEEAIKLLIQEAFVELQNTLGEGLPSDVKDSLQDYVDTTLNATKSLSDAFSSIQNSHEALSEFKSAMSTGLTDDVLNSVGSLSTELNELVAGFYAGTVSAEQLYQALSDHYQTDLKNYGNAIIAKNQYNEDFYDSHILADVEAVNKFKDDYGIDLKNFKSYNEVKLKIGNKTITALGDNWAKYYDAQALALTAEGKRLLSMLSQSSNQESHKQYAEIMEQISQYEQAQKALNDLNNIIYNGIDANFTDVTDSLKDAEQAAKEAEEALKDYIDAYMTYMEKSLESSRIDYQTYSRDVSKFLKGMFDEGKISAKDYFDYTEQMLEVQQNAMDAVVSAVTKRIDDEIKSYEKQQDAIEERYQSEIDYLDSVIKYYEDQKNALTETNDEIDRQLALEKALYEFERAQTQRTKKVYTANNGFVYTVDSEALRNASDDVRQSKLDIELAKLDEAIEQIEKQQDALQEAMDKEKEQIQILIDRLQEYSDMWSKISDAYIDTQNDLLAQQILGADCENQILDGRLDILNNFRDSYIAIQQALSDAAWNSANEQLKAAQAAMNATSGGSSSTPTPTAPSNPNPTPTDTDLKSTLKTPKWYKVVDSNGKQVGNIYPIDKLSDATEKAQDLTASTYGRTQYKVEAVYHSGLNEGYVGSVQSDNTRLDVLQKAGEGKLLPNEVPAILQKGELVLTKAQQINIADSLLQSAFTPNIKLPNYSYLENIPMRNMQPITLNIGDIHVNKPIGNVDSLSKAIINELPNKMLQAINRR